MPTCSGVVMQKAMRRDFLGKKISQTTSSSTISVDAGESWSRQDNQPSPQVAAAM